MEPTLGFEPRTCCLRNSCSTAELCRRGGPSYHAPLSTNPTSPGSSACAPAPSQREGQARMLECRPWAPPVARSGTTCDRGPGRVPRQPRRGRRQDWRARWASSAGSCSAAIAGFLANLVVGGSEGLSARSSSASSGRRRRLPRPGGAPQGRRDRGRHREHRDRRGRGDHHPVRLACADAQRQAHLIGRARPADQPVLARFRQWAQPGPPRSHACRWSFPRCPTRRREGGGGPRRRRPAPGVAG